MSLRTSEFERRMQPITPFPQERGGDRFSVGTVIRAVAVGVPAMAAGLGAEILEFNLMGDVPAEVKFGGVILGVLVALGVGAVLDSALPE